MLALNDASFTDFIAAPQAAVYFWSPACGYCRTFTPIFEGLEAKYAERGVTMAKANIQDAPQAAAAQGLEGVPTVAFFKNGQKVGMEVTGGMTEAEFVALMDAAFPPSEPVPAAGGGGGATPGAEESNPWPLIVVGLLGAGAAYYFLSPK